MTCIYGLHFFHKEDGTWKMVHLYVSIAVLNKK